MPIPLSVTVTCQPSPSAWASTATRGRTPAATNFRALATRFWNSWNRSPQRPLTTGSSPTVSSAPAVSMESDSASPTARITSAQSTRSPAGVVEAFVAVLGQELREAADDPQRFVEVVGQHRGELFEVAVGPDELIGPLLELTVHLLEGVHAVAPLGRVAGDLEVPGERSGV